MPRDSMQLCDEKYIFQDIVSVFFFFNDTATTEIYTLSLHDALPISPGPEPGCHRHRACSPPRWPTHGPRDRKSTRLNSSHTVISYAVFCLKKKKLLHSSKRIPLIAQVVSSAL